MIMTRLEAIGTDAAPAWYDGVERTVFKSSINSNSYSAKMLKRSGVLMDPWISMEDFSVSINNAGVLYVGEDEDVQYQASGAFVFTRNYKTICGYDASQVVDFAKDIDSGGWEARRYVPGNGYNKWHPATD
jgi:hypothetical protein